MRVRRRGGEKSRKLSNGTSTIMLNTTSALISAVMSTRTCMCDLVFWWFSVLVLVRKSSGVQNSVSSHYQK